MKKYIIPAILSLVVGITLWYIQRDVVSLAYDVIESASFPYEDSEGRFFVVTVQNDGTKPIQNANIEIVFQSGSIVTSRFSPEKLISNVKQDMQSINGVLSLLNPGEKMSTTVTVKNRGPISTPTVLARAVGVTATRKSDASVYQLLVKILFTTSIAVFTLLILSGWNNFRQSRVEASIGSISQKSADLENFVIEKDSLRDKWQREAEERDREHEKFMKELQERQKKNEEERAKYADEQAKGKPDREQFIFAILNRSGLAHLFPKLMKLGEGIMYRNTAHLLLHEFLLDEEHGDKYVAALEQLISTEHMAPQSKGVALYLLAKIERYRGNEERAKHFLKKCENEVPLMYAHLMAYDDYYDLKSLQHALQNYGSQ
jgi:hypothetical protein